MLKPSKYSEKELVDACINNDRRAQEVLYRKYFRTMIGMCLRYTDDRDVAMEIVNNGFLRVFKKLDTFSFKGSLEGWIRKLVYHSLSEYFKKNSKYLQFLVFEERDARIEEEALSNVYVEDILKMVDLLSLNQLVLVKVVSIDRQGKIRLSRKEAIGQKASVD